MSSIRTETGAVITVAYADPECTPGNLPSNAHTNSMRCYPVRWPPEFHTEPIEDWFHKHVVSSVVETDTTGGMVAVETYYEYSTAGGGTSVLWAFDDSELTEDEHRTYGVWRGYPQVTTRLGDPAGTQTQTRTRSRFYRGMDGQRLPSGGTRSVDVTDGEGNTVADHEALASGGDEFCERIEYADNNSAWMKEAVARSETVGVSCGTSPSRPADVVSDTLTFYDGSATHGAAPPKGLPTRVDVLDEWSGGPVYMTAGETGYDALGRAVSTTDALGDKSTVTYTPAGAGPVTQKVMTNALGHQETTQLDPAWGVPVAAIEPNGRRTDLTYDALGRSTAVWLPARSKATQSPSMRFEYRVRDNAPSAVISRTLNHVQEYVTTVVLYDSLLRERQTQTETADRGRLVNEIVYDTHGRVEEEFGPNHNLDPPDTTIVRVREDDSARRFEYLYDSAGRVTDEVLYDKHAERWRTTTSYGGSSAGFMVSVQPPEGAPATATIADARGETVQKRTYHSATPTGAYDALTYEYSPTGRLEVMTDAAGNEWSWEYDTAPGGIGMLAKAVRWADGEAYVNEIVRVNAQGLITQGAVTIPASEGPLAGKHFFTQLYAVNGLIAGQGLPEVGELEAASVRFGYDHVGNPTEVRYQGEHTGPRIVVDDATFTPYNEVQTRVLGGSADRRGWQGFVYEEDTRRLQRATFARTASTNLVADVRYTYDDAGNVLSIADVPSDLASNHELQCFQYDSQRRLVEAWAQGDTSDCEASPGISVLGGPAPYWHSYDHDVAGNRVSEVLRAPGEPAATRTYSYLAAGGPRPHALQQVTGAGVCRPASTTTRPATRSAARLMARCRPWTGMPRVASRRWRSRVRTRCGWSTTPMVSG